MLARLDLLSPADCTAIAQQVQDLQRWWVRRHPELPSFTLGAAAYLDVPTGGMHAYLINKMRGNRILERSFQSLLGRVAIRLHEHLDAPVFLTDRLAWPGFHIYQAHEGLAQMKPPLHWDLQDLRIPEWEDVERPPHFSFTVPVELPAAGGGINVWDHLSFGEVDHDTACARARETPPEFHGYRLGELFMHSGDLLHQIATTDLPAEGEVRLTLQGHGRLTDGGWELYW